MRRHKKVLNDIIMGVSRMKDAWLDECMSRILPPEMVVAAHTKKSRHRKKVAKYMTQAKISLAEHPDKTVLMVDGKPVAELAMTFKEGKFEITSRTLPPDTKAN